MAMSTADYFRMMQGGVDRTGYANMMPDRIEKRESIEDRLAKLIEADTAGDDTPPEDTGGDTGEDTGEDTIGSILKQSFVDPYTSVDDSTGEFTDQSRGEAILNRGFTAAALTPTLKRIIVGGKGNPYLTAGLIAPELLYMGAQFVAPETTKKAEEFVGGTLKPAYDKYIDPIVQKSPIMTTKRLLLDPVNEAISNKFTEMGEEQKIKKQIFEDDLIAQGANPESRFFDSAVQGGSMTAEDLSEYEQNMDDLSNLLNLGTAYNDGGRVNRFRGGMSDAQRKSGGSTHSGGPPDGGPDNNKNDLMGPGLDAPTIDPMKAVGYTPMKQPSLIDQVKKYNFLQGVYGDEDDGLSFGYDINPYAEEASAKLSYSFADGGRVGLQNGGNAASLPISGQENLPQATSNFNQPNPSPLPPATQGLQSGSNAFKSAIQNAAVNANSRLGNLVSSAVQAMPQQPSSVYGLGSLLSGMQQSMGPTFRTADFRDSNNDGVDDRDQGMDTNPGMNIEEILASLQSGMPQAYTPYVSTMPLYDPSTLGTGLPSTAGGYDPYVSYDPYAPVGAFSRPPSGMMETPSFGLTQDQIKEGFSDMDRFSLAAQQAKKKAAEEAAKKAQAVTIGGGGGGGGNKYS